MKAEQKIQIDDSIARLVKTAVGGANETIAQSNSTIHTLSGTIAELSKLLADANQTIARQNAEIGELKKQNSDGDRLARLMDLELEKEKLADRRKGEMIKLATRIGDTTLFHVMRSKELPAANPSPGSQKAEVVDTEQKPDETQQKTSVSDLAARLVASLKPDTIALIRRDAGDDLVKALLRALATEERKKDE